MNRIVFIAFLLIAFSCLSNESAEKGPFTLNSKDGCYDLLCKARSMNNGFLFSRDSSLLLPALDSIEIWRVECPNLAIGFHEIEVQFLLNLKKYKEAYAILDSTSLYTNQPFYTHFLQKNLVYAAYCRSIGDIPKAESAIKTIMDSLSVVISQNPRDTIAIGQFFGVQQSFFSKDEIIASRESLLQKHPSSRDLVLLIFQMLDDSLVE